VAIETKAMNEFLMIRCVRKTLSSRRFAAVQKSTALCQVRKSDLTRYSHVQCPKAEFHGMCAVCGLELAYGLREPFGLW
jgi:hypothetical protein